MAGVSADEKRLIEGAYNGTLWKRVADGDRMKKEDQWWDFSCNRFHPVNHTEGNVVCEYNYVIRPRNINHHYNQEWYRLSDSLIVAPGDMIWDWNDEKFYPASLCVGSQVQPTMYVIRKREVKQNDFENKTFYRPPITNGRPPMFSDEHALHISRFMPEGWKQITGETTLTQAGDYSWHTVDLIDKMLPDISKSGCFKPLERHEIGKQIKHFYFIMRKM